MAKRADEKYSDEEAKERMKAALLGARLAGHVPMRKKPKVKKAKKQSRRLVIRPVQED
jgi:hypothetical protein